MTDPGSVNDDSVITTVEMVGEYEQIATILGQRSESNPELESIVADMTEVIEIIQRTDGATKSRITEELPSSLTAEVDAESMIHFLRVLEMYDVVTLDGNTWRPGPVISQT